MPKPFIVKDCSLGVLSTGLAAASLLELKEIIGRISLSSIYFHFWGRHFRPAFDHPELPNDFARWTYLHLHDRILSERLGILDPTDFINLEDLRLKIIELIEERIDELRYVLWSTENNRFHFLSSVTVIYETQKTIQHPSELKTLIPHISFSSLFYHFIDARRRTENRVDDFSTWLAEFGGDSNELLRKIQHIDPFFLSLSEQRKKLTELVEQYFS